jgi:hypothetical protein
MVDDTARRLGNTVQELRDLIVRVFIIITDPSDEKGAFFHDAIHQVSARKFEELADSEELVAADDVLEEASV